MFGKSDYYSERTKSVDVNAIAHMKNHPFYVRKDEELNRLMESIEEQGLLVPILVRPNPDSYGVSYEIVSGHRRYEACKRLGYDEVPVLIRELSDDEAIIAMVDSNLHREKILPSEKAFAYKMKFDALKRQGARSDLASEQVEPRLSTEIIAEQENTSKDTIKRYIRLTNLVKPLLDLVDEGRIALTPAEKLSYLKKEEQLTLAGLIWDFEATPSLSQATRFKDLSMKGKLDSDTMFDLLTQPKPNQKETLKLDLYKLRDLFPNCSPNDMEKSILQILNDWYKHEQEKEKSQNGWSREER